MHRFKRSGRLQQNWVKLIFCKYEMRSVSDAKNVLQNAFMLCAVFLWVCVHTIRKTMVCMCWTGAKCLNLKLKGKLLRHSDEITQMLYIFNDFGLQYWPIDIVVSWFISSLHLSTPWYYKRVNSMEYEQSMENAHNNESNCCSFFGNKMRAMDQRYLLYVFFTWFKKTSYLLQHSKKWIEFRTIVICRRLVYVKKRISLKRK